MGADKHDFRTLFKNNSAILFRLSMIRFFHSISSFSSIKFAPITAPLVYLFHPSFVQFPTSHPYLDCFSRFSALLLCIFPLIFLVKIFIFLVQAVKMES
jgi:hypothetical protein